MTESGDKCAATHTHTRRTNIERVGKKEGDAGRAEGKYMRQFYAFDLSIMVYA